jgi:hypothetical protein
LDLSHEVKTVHLQEQAIGTSAEDRAKAVGAGMVAGRTGFSGTLVEVYKRRKELLLLLLLLLMSTLATYNPHQGPSQREGHHPSQFGHESPGSTLHSDLLQRRKRRAGVTAGKERSHQVEGGDRVG